MCRLVEENPKIKLTKNTFHSPAKRDRGWCSGVLTPSKHVQARTSTAEQSKAKQSKEIEEVGGRGGSSI